MFRLPKSFVFTLVILAAFATALTAKADQVWMQANVPKLVVISGPGIDRPLVLRDHEENSALMKAIKEEANNTPDSLAGRPYFDIGFYLETDSSESTSDTSLLSKLENKEADTKGRFYPALGAIPAVISVESGTDGFGNYLLVGPEAMTILKAHGLRTEIESTFVPSVEQTGPYATWMVGLALFFLIGGGAVALRKRLIDNR